MSRLLGKRCHAADAGFTLVETLVAVLIFAAAAAALIPLMLVSVKAAGTARLETQAKNLTQQQIERMRNLTFHVAHENGDYVDLLDLYFTNVATTAATLTPSSSPRNSKPYGDADGSVTVRYLTDAGGAAGRPSGPAYRVSGLQLTGYPAFSLEVYTQFLRTTRTVATPEATYDSQTAAADSPPAQLVGITVLTTWTDSSGPQTYRTYTEIADGRGIDALLTTQARATAIRITGTDSSANNLLVQAGVVQADGSVTSGSSASVAAEAARLEQVGIETALGQNSALSAPPSPAGSTAASTVLGQRQLSGATLKPCGWGSVGSTQVSNVSAATSMQQPLVPSNGGTDVSGAAAERVAAGVITSGGDCDDYNLSFRPDADGNWTPATAFALNTSKPLVGIPDTGDSGLDDAAASGKGQVAATSLVSAPISSSAYAGAQTKAVEILPLTSGYESGLVRATLASSSMTCRSDAVTRAAYNLTVVHPTGTVNLVWDSASPTPVAMPDPASIAFTVGGVSHTLSEYLSWSVASEVSDGTNGVSTFGPVLRVTINQAVLGTATDVTVEMGVLSCVADDRR